jgi:hypothetical protein
MTIQQGLPTEHTEHTEKWFMNISKEESRSLSLAVLQARLSGFMPFRFRVFRVFRGQISSVD